jgi:hypothetical protein
LVNPKTGAEVIRGIEDYLVKNRIDRVENLIGLFNKGRVPLNG